MAPSNMPHSNMAVQESQAEGQPTMPLLEHSLDIEVDDFSQPLTLWFMLRLAAVHSCVTIAQWLSALTPQGGMFSNFVRTRRSQTRKMLKEHGIHELSTRDVAACLLQTVSAIGVFCLPSFLHKYVRTPSRRQDSKESSLAHHSTAFLDGLRGWASLMVYMEHTTACEFDVSLWHGEWN